MNNLLEKYRAGELMVKEVVSKCGKLFRHGDVIRANNCSAIVTLGDEGAEWCNELVKRTDYLVIKSALLDALPVSVEDFDLSASQAAGMDGEIKMITCKEDLVNTYIENDNGVLRDAYVSLCRLHGVHSCGAGPEFQYLYEKPYITVSDFGVDTGPQTGWNLTPMPEYKQLTLTDLLPTSYENTKVYSLDEDVIRKYAELCGVEYRRGGKPTSKEVGVRNPEDGCINTFCSGSKTDSQVGFCTTLTAEQILAAWNLKFNSGKDVEWSTENVWKEKAEELVNETKIDIASIKDTQAAGMVIGDPKPDLNDLCEKYFWIIDDCKNNEDYRLSVKRQLSAFSRELESLKQDKQPKKTVKYVKCEFKSLWNPVKEWEDDSSVFYFNSGTNDRHAYDKVTDFTELAHHLVRGNIYRRTEVEVDWRKEVESKFSGIKFRTKCDSVSFHGNAWEQSKLIEMCHLVASLTTKPEGE